MTDKTLEELKEEMDEARRVISDASDAYLNASTYENEEERHAFAEALRTYDNARRAHLEAKEESND